MQHATLADSPHTASVSVSGLGLGLVSERNDARHGLESRPESQRESCSDSDADGTQPVGRGCSLRHRGWSERPWRGGAICVRVRVSDAGLSAVPSVSVSGGFLDFGFGEEAWVLV